MAESPLIRTPSLTLRCFAPRDAGKIFEMSQEEQFQTWLPSQVYRNEDHATAVLDFLIAQCRAPADPRWGPYVLGVELNNSGELVGHVGFSPYSDAVEVGFAIGRDHQRQGLASEAVLAASEWMSRTFSLETILGIASEKNLASRAVLNRAGYSWQKTEVAELQGVKQSVAVFAYSRKAESGIPKQV